MAVDGSPPSQIAVELGIRLARGLGGTLTLLHVSPLREHPLLTSEEETVDGETRALSLLESAAAVCRGVGIRPQTATARGRPATEILRYLRRHPMHLVVLGSRGLGGATSVLLGSVSREVVRDAPCSVVLARATAGLVASDRPGGESAALERRPEPES